MTFTAPMLNKSVCGNPDQQIAVTQVNMMAFCWPWSIMVRGFR